MGLQVITMNSAHNQIDGKKLSEWLALALSDMEALAVSEDNVSFDMNFWLLPEGFVYRRATDGKPEELTKSCLVCLFGAMLLRGRVYSSLHRNVTGMRNVRVYDLDSLTYAGETVAKFINLARFGVIYRGALESVTLESEISDVSAKLVEKGFILSSNPNTFGRDGNRLEYNSSQEYCPEADRSTANVRYAAYVKEKLQPMVTALEEIGL
jgi:hypothetical protein